MPTILQINFFLKWNLIYKENFNLERNVIVTVLLAMVAARSYYRIGLKKHALLNSSALACKALDASQVSLEIQ